MPSSLSVLATRLSATRAAASRERVAAGVVILLHLVALAIMLRYEDDVIPKGAFLLAWVILNCFWLVLLRRPALAGARPNGLSRHRGSPRRAPRASLAPPTRHGQPGRHSPSPALSLLHAQGEEGSSNVSATPRQGWKPGG